MATKRRRSGDATPSATLPPPPKRRASSRAINSSAAVVDPTRNSEILDAPNALRASPDVEPNRGIVPNGREREESPLSDAPEVLVAPSVKTPAKGKGRGKKAAAETNGDGVAVKVEESATPAKGKAKAKKAASSGEAVDPEADEDEEADEEEVKEALARPPPVNSDYLPLPWKGRLGYACLNTYLRNSNPPVFSSRTCRIQSILEHRHPLQDPTQPEHPTKNRPDPKKPADVALGQRYVESLGLANVKDIEKMLRWNDRYNIKFLRLSSEMFPFASHPEYGYKLAPFASDALAAAGRVVAELGHRVTTHPGQFTQLGSPRAPVIENAIRDLEYHDEMLSLLRLPEQANRDAVMILHMGGMFEGKPETLQRFRENYARLSESVKARLVLENDDMGWSVHDLLPICEELNIPMVLDFHHHNIVFDSTQIREGTRDIVDLYPRIRATWDRKGIRQKMHYSEPTPPAVTPRQRRKHSPRVATLPPCAPDMDLMIEAKDKEQAVFELMRTFKLPGFETFADVTPYVREDDNKAVLAAMNRKKTKAQMKKEEEEGVEEVQPQLIPDEEVGMGGPLGRVYWPPGMEEWLRPKKREVKKKASAEDGEDVDNEEGSVSAKKGKKTKTKAQIKAEGEALYAAHQAELAAAKGGVKVEEDSESDLEATPATKKAKAAMRKKARADAEKAAGKVNGTAKSAAKVVVKQESKKGRKAKAELAVPTPSASDEDEGELSLDDEEEEAPVTPAVRRQGSRKGVKRSAKVSYAEDDDDELMADD